MKRWEERTVEEAHLLNPAFCCAVLSASAVGYASEALAGLPFALSFLVLPTTLHKRTRESLPRDTRTSMAAWLQQNGEARVGFAQRVIAVRPHTREAILFGTIHGWLTLSGGLLAPTVNERAINSSAQSLETEARECLRRATFVGKWFARAGNAATVMALWGVRP
jgi:hypothetical protein